MQARAEDKAAFCLATGVPPSEYDGLYQHEVDAFIKRWKEINRTVHK